MDFFDDQLTPYYLRLNLERDADERTIKRAYARELKLIDHEADVAAFQELRAAYEGALSWLRHVAHMELEASPAALAAEPVHGAQSAVPPVPPVPLGDIAQCRCDPALMAQQVYADLMRVCATFGNDDDTAAAWQRALRASLADERLIDLGARQAFETMIADGVARGWQPGTNLLFAAACGELEWAVDRRRVLGLGAAGYVINAAIEQRAVYESQSGEQYGVQEKLLLRLRDARPPSNAELISAMPVLAAMQARFPAWLVLATDAANIRRWHDLDQAMPAWRRWRPSHVSQGWAVFIGIACMVVFLIGAVISSPQQFNVDRHLRAAKQLIEANDPEAALPHLDRAVREAPNNALALGKRALTLVATADFDGARRDLDALEHLDREHPDLYLGRGLIALETGEYAAAIAALSRSLELSPSNNYARLARARSYQRMGKLDEALADADAVLKREPGRIGAYLLRARVFHARGDATNALAEANAMVTANGHNDEAYSAAAEVHFLRRDPAAAMAVLAQGIERAPSASLYLLHADGREFGDFEGRRSDIGGVLRLAPDAPEGLSLQVQLELDSGQYEAALATASAALEKVTKRDDRIMMFASRGVAYEKQGKLAEAGDQFKTARMMASSAADLNLLCWQMAVNQASLPTALANCQLALEHEPGAAFILDSKGFVLLMMKRYSESISAYDAAIAVRPGMALSLYGRGIAKHGLGKTRSGKADIDAALALQPKVGEFFRRYQLLPRRAAAAAPPTKAAR